MAIAAASEGDLGSAIEIQPFHRASGNLGGGLDGRALGIEVNNVNLAAGHGQVALDVERAPVAAYHAGRSGILTLYMVNGDCHVALVGAGVAVDKGNQR